MKSTALRWAMALALFALVGTTLAFRDLFDAATLSAWVEYAGAAGPIVFIAVYAAATVLFLPGALVTLAGGALFGPLWGTVWNLTGATLGSALAFLIARYLGADWVSRRAGPRLQRLNAGVADEGWRFIAFVRLVPLFPFNLLNYALGLTRIRFADLRRGQRGVHAARGTGLHLAGPCRPPGVGGRRRHGAQWADCAGAGLRGDLPAALAAQARSPRGEIEREPYERKRRDLKQ